VRSAEAAATSLQSTGPLWTVVDTRLFREALTTPGTLHVMARDYK
jgi:hypothetical protein